MAAKSQDRAAECETWKQIATEGVTHMDSIRDWFMLRQYCESYCEVESVSRSNGRSKQL